MRDGEIFLVVLLAVILFLSGKTFPGKDAVLGLMFFIAGVLEGIGVRRKERRANVFFAILFLAAAGIFSHAPSRGLGTIKEYGNANF